MTRALISVAAWLLATSCTCSRVTEPFPVERVGSSECQGEQASLCASRANALLEGDTIEGVEEARRLFGLACDGGSMSSCGMYGGMLVKGEGGPVDLEPGLDLLRRHCSSRDRHSHLSCYDLGYAYANGDPSELGQDLLQGLTYFERACGPQDAEACQAAARLVTSDQMKEPDLARGASLAQRACRYGSQSACADLEEAIPKWREACAEGVETACEGVKVAEAGLTGGE